MKIYHFDFLDNRGGDGMVDLVRFVKKEDQASDVVEIPVVLAPGQQPVSIRAKSSMSVEDLTRKIALHKNVSPESICLAVKGQPLDKRLKLGELVERMGSEVVEVIPNPILG